MKLTSAGIDLIKSRESCRLKAYQCPAGIWTIGYGHTGPEVHDNLEITQGEADILLQSDLIIFDAGVSRICPSGTDCQHSAMVSLAYNIGIGNFSRSSVARLHNAEKYAEAAQAFALWNKAAGVVLAGLVSRRAAEAALYLQDAPAENVPNGEGEKPLVASRTINGQAIAGAGAAATAGLSSFKDSAVTRPGWQGTVNDLMPYFDQLKWVVLAVVIFGIGMTLYARWHDRHEGRV
ncbi:MAG: lysozyme [Rhodospirillaceae bacterium]|nr:MAG: lysozyme [Rhodospirillaceae bacterium]